MPSTLVPSAVAPCSSAGHCARSRRPVQRSGATPRDRQLIRPTKSRAIFSRLDARLGSVCTERAKYHSGIAEPPHTIPGKTATDPLRGLCGTLARAQEPTTPASSAAMPHYTVATSPITLSARGSVQSGFNEVALERRIYSGGGHWTLAHRRWLARQAFNHPAQQIVFQEGVDAIDDAAQRLRRLDEQLAAIVPTWSLATSARSTSVTDASAPPRGVAW